jgi:hypothetical protein
MNEQIEELAKQSGIGLFKDNSFGWSVLAGTDSHLQKFAELIVAECIKTITEYDLVPGHSAKWEDIYDIHARLLQDLGEELKEHFGVEE